MLNRRRLLLGGAALVAAATLAGIPTVVHGQSGDLSPEGIAWLKANALPLTTAEPGSGIKDLEQLRAVIGSARVVSLGEATHGTREFFQLKHRAMEYCISQLGFTVIGFEADYGATLAVNDYVLHGKGNAKDATTGMGFWTWNTEEVQALVEWVRAWNQTHERKVKFYGFDMQSYEASALRLLAYLQEVAPALATESERILGRLCSHYTGTFDLAPAADREQMFAQLKTVLGAFDAERAPWSAQTSEVDWHQARQSAVVVQQCATIQMIDLEDDFWKGFEFRDRCMADNVHALLAAEGPGTRMLLWAHNGHVQAAPDLGASNMGSHLRAELGADYLPVGFAFNQGGFRAKGTDGVLHDFVVGPTEADTVDGALAATGIPLFALDLRHVPADGPVARWMATQPLQRSIGAIFAPEQEQAAMASQDPREAFDILVFVERTTAARGIKRPPRTVAYGPNGVTKANPEPTNLGFTSGAGTLAGWTMTDNSLDPYAFVVEDGASPAGGRAVRIARMNGSLPFGDAALMQSFPAPAWRGRRLTFRAAIRADAPRAGTGAALLVHAWPKDAKAKPILLMQADGFVRSPDWVNRTVAVDVPADAERLQVTVTVTGSAAGWFGDLAVGSEPGATASWSVRSVKAPVRPVPLRVSAPSQLRL